MVSHDLKKPKTVVGGNTNKIIHVERFENRERALLGFSDDKKPNQEYNKGSEKMSSSFNQRYERKFNGNYNWSNPIWRRFRLRQLRAKHERREMFQENPNWLQERYPNWDWRTETDRRLESTVGRN